jgi:ketosteroid isomerase-like protein
MSNRTPRELATQLVQAFGRPDEMVASLTDDVTWWISPSVPPEVIPNPCVGKDTVRETVTRLFTLVYRADTAECVIHSAIGEGNLGTIRFTLNSELVAGGSYSNEYCVCIETRGDAIAKVWEYVDMAWAATQMQNAGVDVDSVSSA